MSGRLINGIKYMYINDDNNLKKKSLEDNLYFSLRDIFWNSASSDTCIEANAYNDMLTNNICYEERTEKFCYTNILYQKDSVEKILRWLNSFKKVGWFEFLELEEGEEIIEEEYMKFDDWWNQFEELRSLIRVKYEKLEKWEEEDVQRDTDRLAELSDNTDY